MSVHDGVKESPDSSSNSEADRSEVQHFQDWKNIESESDV